MRRDAKPLTIRLSYSERDKIEERFGLEGRGHSGISSWARSVLIPEGNEDSAVKTIRWIEDSGLGFLLDREHPKVRDALRL